MVSLENSKNAKGVSKEYFFEKKIDLGFELNFFL